MRAVLCRCGPTGSAMFEATQSVAGVSLDLLGSGLIKLLRLQREIQRSLAGEFMATRDSAGLLRPTLLMAMAFAFGGFPGSPPHQLRRHHPRRGLAALARRSSTGRGFFGRPGYQRRRLALLR